MTAILKFLRRLPFTLIMLLVLSLVAFWTNTYLGNIPHLWLNRLGFAPRDLLDLNLERLFTSALVTGGGSVFWKAFAMILIFVGAAEWLTGTKHTGFTFWGVHLLALMLLTVIITLSHHQLRQFGLEAAIAARDVGPSAGYFACLGLLSGWLKPPANWISGVVLLTAFIIALLIPAASGQDAQVKFSADLAHLLAFPLGWLSAGLGRERRNKLAAVRSVRI
jgi:hypothetical protein